MKTPKDSLEFIAYQNGLALIETTSQSNGYPSHLQHAIIGIDSFEQAEKLAEENDLSIEIFTKRDGWNLYYRTGNVAYKELTVSSDDFGDDYRQFNRESAKTFFKEEVQPLLENYDDLESLGEFIEAKKEVLEKIEDLEENELVITNAGKYYDTVEKQSMVFHNDGRTTVIGLIGKFSE